MATNTYVALDKITVGTATSSVTFSSIPAGYTDLQIVSVVRCSNAGQSDTLAMRLNGDSAGNYSWTLLRGNGSTASSLRSSNTTYLGIAEVIGAAQTAGIFNVVTTNLMNYSNTTTNKTAISRSSVSANYGAEAWATMWRNTAAVTSINLSMVNGSNIVTGSTFSLYGIASAEVGAKATGGVISSDASYWYHTFLASGTFTPTQSISADVLVVAGGGGGGGARTSIHYAGGGGAGGVLGFSSQSLTATNYTVTIGAGGALGTGSYPSTFNNGTQGGNSSFGALTVCVGGGYGATASNAGGNGGSGGGGGSYTGTPAGGSATSGQGNAGGTGGTQAYVSGGGGGAGAAGANSSGSSNGLGGSGVNTVTNWGTLAAVVAAAGVGVGGYIAGGGQGTASTTSAALGGGGAAGTDSGGSGGTPPTAGTANTGSGGAGGQANGTQNGSNGGSGIVIVRYAK
jgi:hypothetical protein